MTTPLSERDLITLNAYLDGELPPRERAAFEQRLASESALQEELEGLRVTVALLKLAEPVRVPRNFTLDPALHGRSQSKSLWQRIGLTGAPRLAVVGAMVVGTLVCAGAVVFGLSRGGQFASAPEPMMVAQEEAAADRAAPAEEPQAMEAAPAAEATEEPAAEEPFAAQEAETQLIAPTPSPGGGVGGAGGGGEEPREESGGAGVPPSANTDQGDDGISGELSTANPSVEMAPMQATEVSEGVGGGVGAEGAQTEQPSEIATPELTARDTQPYRFLPSFPVVALALGVLGLVLVVALILSRRARRR